MVIIPADRGLVSEEVWLLVEPLRLDERLEPERDLISNTVPSSSSDSDSESEDVLSSADTFRRGDGSTTTRCSTNELKLMCRLDLAGADESSETW